MAVSTRSRSISSTAFRARLPPAWTRTSKRRSLSARSTSRTTSSRRSRGRASHTRTGRSSPARRRRWRATSSGVVEALVGAGYRWYETANFCRPRREAQHNLGYWLGHDYLGVGIGAVSTVGADRWRNAPSLARYVGALAAGVAPPRETEELDATTKLTERLMLGLRLDRPLAFADVSAAVEGRAGAARGARTRRAARRRAPADRAWPLPGRRGDGRAHGRRAGLSDYPSSMDEAERVLILSLRQEEILRASSRATSPRAHPSARGRLSSVPASRRPPPR